VQGMLAVVPTILFQFQFFGIRFLILIGVVIDLTALGAFQSDQVILRHGEKLNNIDLISSGAQNRD
jgi:hypothetical protein